MTKPLGWIGVDLDGTLAKRIPGRKWMGDERDLIGDPVPSMLARVIDWIDAGREVRIFTARMSHDNPVIEKVIRAWCLKHIGCELRVTCSKDYLMAELWDDRAVTVEKDTGRVLTLGIEPALQSDGCGHVWLPADGGKVELSTAWCGSCARQLRGIVLRALL